MNIREEFLNNHLVHLKGALPRSLCEDWVQDYFTRTGIDESDPGTFPQEPDLFSERTRTIPMRDASPMIWDAVCELLGGEAQIDERTRHFNNSFNLNINKGAHEVWKGPSSASPGWHKDGWFFRHFLDSPEQALLCLVIWRDIQPRSGGTFFASDSVTPICKDLLAHPEGLPHTRGWGRFVHECKDFRELTAETGDVFILHPFMLHAPSQNPSGRIRFMNNKVVSLNKPMQFNRPHGDYTALEASILQALQVESLNFHITGERKRTEDFSCMEEETAATT